MNDRDFFRVLGRKVATPVDRRFAAEFWQRFDLENAPPSLWDRWNQPVAMTLAASAVVWLLFLDRPTAVSGAWWRLADRDPVLRRELVEAAETIDLTGDIDPTQLTEEEWAALEQEEEG